LGANTTVTFRGTLVSGAVTVPLTRTVGDVKSGFNLIVNPYPSFVNITTPIPGETVKTFWTRSYDGASEMVFDTYNTELGTGINLSGNAPSSYIAPMQAYWVKLSTGSVGSLELNNTNRTLVDITAPSNKLKAPAQTTQQILRLKLSNGTSSDEAIIAFNQNAVDGFDSYDSEKMMNENALVPEIFTTVSNEKVAINGMNSITYNTPINLGLTQGSASEFTIKANEVSNFDTDTKIVLVDNVLSTETDITNGQVYSFNANSANNTRFSVIFKSVAVSTKLNKATKDKLVSVSNYNNGQISVSLNNSDATIADITLFNTLGQTLVNQFSTGNTTIIKKQLKAGIYFVNVNVSGLKITKKLIVE
jgi:hypothetical protein